MSHKKIKVKNIIATTRLVAKEYFTKKQKENRQDQENVENKEK